MNDQPRPPLQIDARLGLEAAVDVIGIILAGVVILELGMPLAGVISLGLTAVLAGINRILGRSNATAIEDLKTSINALMARDNVFQAEASATVKKQADAAAEAVKPGITAAPPVAP